MAKFDVQVTSPCSGGNVVSQITSSMYIGTRSGQGADQFPAIVLTKNSTRWYFSTYIDDSSPSGCTSSQKFLQVAPDLADPTGTYFADDGSGNPDPSMGEGVVANFPP